jgi:peptidoglycan hydrolase-like protein with peptidoglycan-binding domain
MQFVRFKETEDMPAISSALSARARPAALLLATAIALGALFAGSAAATSAYSAASAKPQPIPWTGWNGRPVERPHAPVDVNALTSVSLPAGWKAGAVRFGTGYHRAGGSQRVREVQHRLTRLGYHLGPVDGLYGPLTRSAVQWFQIKHGLRPTGVVAATTLAVLRDPTALVRARNAQAKRPAPASPPVRAIPAAHPTTAAAKSTHGTPAWIIPALLGLLVLALVLGTTTVVRAIRSARAPTGADRPPRQIPAPSPAPAPASTPVLGYLTNSGQEDAVAHEAAIRAACARHGWTLARLVREGHASRARPLGRPGLAYALEQLSEGRASRLVVDELEQLAGSVTELRIVLGWFLRMGIALTALDVGLDTSTPEGRSAVRALLMGQRSRPDRAPASGSPD